MSTGNRSATPHYNSRMHSNSPQTSTLGQATEYGANYDPSRLFPIPRAQGRAALGIEGTLPFFGMDLWNGYELSWLDPRGKPRIAIAKFAIPATSDKLIESKSFKLYLNGFAGTRFADAGEVTATLVRDLSQATVSEVGVSLLEPGDFTSERIEPLPGEVIDDVPVDIECYGPPQASFLEADAGTLVEETLVSHLLKSNCPVTGQPDWASVQIVWRGPRLSREGLLRYLVSFREHSDFHEHCVERIFCDLRVRFSPEKLSVYARYTRRGGLDINPFRSSENLSPPNPRTARQ